jgi:hypothetical protein
MTTHAGGENDYDSDNSNNNPASGDLQTWEKVKAKLSEYLSADAFTRWFKNAELIETGGEEGVIGVQSDMQQIWIETNYLDELRAAFAEGAWYSLHSSSDGVWSRGCYSTTEAFQNSRKRSR